MTSVFTTSTRDYRLLVASALSGAVLDAADVNLMMRAVCKEEGQSQTPPPSPDSAFVSLGADYFTVVVVPSSTTAAECAQRWDSDRLSIWRGLSFGQSHEGAPTWPRSIRFMADDSVVEPVRAIAHQAHSVRNGSWEHSRSQLRYYYPMKALSPRADGKARRLSVEVWDESGRPSTVIISDAAVQRMVVDYALWRIATSTPRNRTVQFAPRHQAASAMLQPIGVVAHESLRDAALRLSPHVVETSTEATDGVDVTSLLMGEADLAAGDVPAAKSMIRAAWERSECVEAPAGSSEQLRELVTIIRGLPCSPKETQRAFATGLLLPGGGHFVNANRAGGFAFMGIVGGALATALRTNAAASSRLAAYQASRDYYEAPRLYEETTALRAQTRTWLAAGVALWLSDAFLAALEGHVRNALIDRQKL
jgi:hypothetical protein